MVKVSAPNIILIMLNVIATILTYIIVGFEQVDAMFIVSFFVLVLFYISINIFTFSMLRNKGLTIFNFILCVGTMLWLFATYSAQIMGISSFGIGSISLVILIINCVIFLIIDIIVFFNRKYSTNKQIYNNDSVTDQVYIQNVKYPKDNNLNKETIANTQDSIPNTQFTELTDNQKIINAQNVEHNQYDNVVENNITIDLNKLTSEQKDQLLKVLLQNNQKTNE